MRQVSSQGADYQPHHILSRVQEVAISKNVTWGGNRQSESHKNPGAIAIRLELWNFPSLDKEGWREAPGWFEAAIPQLTSDAYILPSLLCNKLFIPIGINP
jgi:hypothetical protein